MVYPGTSRVSSILGSAGVRPLTRLMTGFPKIKKQKRFPTSGQTQVLPAVHATKNLLGAPSFLARRGSGPAAR